MKFCINCQHFREARGSSSIPIPITPSKCLRLGFVTEPVRGRLIPVRVLSPHVERANPCACGPEAKFFLQV